MLILTSLLTLVLAPNIYLEPHPVKMLPLYSCIISEHPGVPGGEAQEALLRRVGGTLLFAGLRIHLLRSCPAHFAATLELPEVQTSCWARCRSDQCSDTRVYSAKIRQNYVEVRPMPPVQFKG